MNLLTPRQVADLMGVHVQTIYREDLLPKVRVGRGIRYRRGDIERYIQTHTIPPRKQPPKCVIIPSEELKMRGKRKAYYSFGFGSVIVRKRKDGVQRYYLDYHAGGKRVREVANYATCLEDAVSALKDKMGLTDVKRVSFESWAGRYLDSHIKPHLKKPRSEELRLGNLKAWFKVDDLWKITPTTIDEFRAWRLREGNAKPTVNRYIAL